MGLESDEAGGVMGDLFADVLCTGWSSVSVGVGALMVEKVDVWDGM